MSKDVSGSPLPEARRRRILGMVEEGAVVRTADLAQRLGVTMMTVRRDIDALADEGRVRRVHGGVTHVGGLAEIAPVIRGVGMLVPALDYYWPEVIRGAEAAAQRWGGRVMAAGVGSGGRTLDELRRFDETGVLDAVLVAPDLDAPDHDAVLAYLAEMAVPVVYLERSHDLSLFPHIDAVVSDYGLGVELARRHLADLGHERMALVTSGASPHAAEIAAAWAGTGPILTVPARADAHWREALVATMDAVQAADVTAVLAHSDHEAVGMAQEAARRGVVVPSDLSLIAYDDQLASFFDPALTAVHPYPDAVGQAAVESAVARLSDPSRPSRRTVVSPSLVVRSSTSIPRSAGS